MTPRTSPRHPFKALVAIAAMFAIVHGVCAQAGTRDDDDDEIANVSVVGQLPLHQACPDLDDEELADELATLWDDVAKPSSVGVTFTVQNHHVYDVAPQADSLHALHRVRRVVHGLSCDGGDDDAHAVHFVIRFAERDDGTRTASISDVTIDAAAVR